MAKQHKRKTSYTVLLVPNTPEKKQRELHALPVLITTVLLIFLIICAVGIAVISYQQGVIINKQNTIDSKDSEIVSANDAIKDLKKEIVSLNQVITSANKAVDSANKEKDEAVAEYLKLSEEVYNLCAPTGCPVTGTATVPDNSRSGNNHLVTFETYVDANVIAAGNGTVESVLNTTTQETPSSEYTYVITINHGNGYKSIYQCNETPMVVEGDPVEKGQPLFKITVESEQFGYQIIEDDSYIDPWTMIEIYG